jgi:hypothetical protein
MFNLYDENNNLLKSWTNIVFLIDYIRLLCPFGKYRVFLDGIPVVIINAEYNGEGIENTISVSFLGTAWNEKLFFNEVK